MVGQAHVCMSTYDASFVCDGINTRPAKVMFKVLL